MLLSVNINVNFVNNILTFIVIVYLEAAIQGFSLKQPFISGILEEFPSGSELLHGWFSSILLIFLFIV